jgi:thiol-disulfide isomerase/thioredoxin
MKSKLLIFTFLMLACVFTNRAEGIAWSNNFEEAEKIAKETGKPLMLDFTAEWCSICRQMDRVFWTRAEVIELSKDFVNIKIDGEKFPQIADRFGVRGYPTVVFADAWNAARDNYMGFGRNGDRVIIDKAKHFPKSFSNLKAAGKLLEKNKSKVDGLMDFAEFYRENKLYILSVRIYREVLNIETKPAKREIAMLNSASDYLKIGQPAESLKLYEQLQKEFPKSRKTDEFLYGIFYSNLRRNSFTQAESNLTQLKTDFPDSKFTVQAEDLLAKTKKN